METVDGKRGDESEEIRDSPIFWGIEEEASFLVHEKGTILFPILGAMEGLEGGEREFIADLSSPGDDFFWDRRGDLAVLDDDDSIADSFHFGKDVAGKKHRSAFLLFFLDDIQEERLHRRIEAGGRFVEDIDFRGGKKRGENGDLSFRAQGHVACPFVQIDAEKVGKLSYRIGFTLPQGKLYREEFPPGQVLRQGHFPGDVADLLEDSPIFSRLFSEKHCRAGIGFGKTHQMAYGRRLSGTVRTEEADAFPFLHLKRDMEDASSVRIILREIGDFDYAHFYRKISFF